MASIEELKLKNEAKRANKLKKLAAKDATKEKHKIQIEKKHARFVATYSRRKNQAIDNKIASIRAKTKVKIATLKKELKNIDLSQVQEEKDKIDKSWKLKYYTARIAILEKRFKKKEQKVLYQEKIGKTTRKDALSKIDRLKVDVGSAYERWNVKIIKANALTSDQKLKNKIKTIEQITNKNVVALENRKKSTAPNNFFKSLRDRIDNVESNFVFGVEIRDIINRISNHIRKYSMFYVLAIILVIFAFTTKGLNLKADTFMNVIQNNTYILIIGLGMLLVIVGGYIDLSVGSLMGFMGAMSIIIYNQFNNFPLTLIFVILLGALIGFVQGVLIGYFKMPAFIVTLGAMLLFQGLILTVTNSETLVPNAPLRGASSYIESITGIMPDLTVGSFHLFGFVIIFTMGIISTLLMLYGRSKKAKYGLATEGMLPFSLKLGFIIGLFSLLAFYVGTSIFGLRYYILYIIILVAIFIFITQNTSFGRKVYAIGGNKKAAQLSGINSARITVYIFMITGILVGFAAIVFTAVMTSASPQVSSQGYELDVISSVFVGGASMAGGVGSVAGTFIGGMILGYIRDSMNLMNLQADMQKIVKALVLLTAVGYDVYSNRKIG